MFKALIGLLALGCATQLENTERSSRSTKECHELSGSWQLDMAAQDSGETVVGTIDWAGRRGNAHLLAESVEGTQEAFDVPIENLRLKGDSISFTFAPIVYSLAGTCVTADSIKGRFSVPQPPFEPDRGIWQMTRIK